MAQTIDEQIAERRRQLVMLMAQSNRDRELIATAREQIGQLEQWLTTLERGIGEKDRAVADVNAELAHLERLKGGGVPDAQVLAPPPRQSTSPVPAPGPPNIAPVAPLPVTAPPPVAAPEPPAFAPPPAAPPPAATAPPTAAPAPSTGEEARQFMRKPVCARVEMEGDTNFFVGFSQNISEGGLFIATYDTMPRGTQFRLNFTLPTHQHPIAAVVEVVWVREYQEGEDLTEGTLPGMGVRFLEIGNEQRKAIARFADVREPMFLPME